MSSETWRCRVIRSTEGALVMHLPDGLADALHVASGDEIDVARGRGGMFDLWKVEPPVDWSIIVERLNRLTREESR